MSFCLKFLFLICFRPQHFYDMAEHKSCGGLFPINRNLRTCTNALDLNCFTKPTNDLILNTTIITSSSSTTGCSTASTSGSGCLGSGSDDSSLLHRIKPGDSNLIVVDSSSTTAAVGDHPCGCLHIADSQICVPPTSPCLTPQILAEPSPQRCIVSLSSEASLSEVVYESWYQPDLPRDKALEMLSKQPVSWFLIYYQNRVSFMIGDK